MSYKELKLICLFILEICVILMIGWLIYQLFFHKDTEQKTHTENIESVSIIEENFQQSYIIRTKSHTFVLSVNSVLITDVMAEVDVATISEENELISIAVTPDTYQYILKYKKVK